MTASAEASAAPPPDRAPPDDGDRAGAKRASEPGDPESVAMRRRVQTAVAVRLLVGLVLLGASYAVTQGASFTADAIFALLVGVFASSLVFAVWLVTLPRHLERLAYAVIATDLCVTTGLVYVTGGAHSGFSFLFGIVVLGAALVVGPRPTLVAAGLAPILYATVAFGLANGWMPRTPDQTWADVRASDAELSFAILRNLVGLLLVGGLAALLSDRLHRTTGALARATESAADSARLTEDIVRSLASGLVTTDLEGVVQTINLAGARILGGAPEELVGSRVDALFPGAMLDVGGRHETEARRRDGSSVPVGYSRNELVSHDGVVRGSLVLFQDLSELAALREKAERAERLAAVGKLAAGLAHEIRNPLGAISGSVELVRDAAVLGDEDRGLLETVLREVDRLNELVSTMLEAGRPTTPERRDVDLRELAREVVTLAGRHPVAANAKITLIAPEAVPASIDPAQIRQVIWNLVKNALQFSPPGGEVRVDVHRDGKSVHLSVSDQGPGVGEADLPHLFDMFFTKRRHGVGLGLALAKQVVEAHGGTIGASRAPGGGATFTVVLPLPEPTPA